MATFKVGGRFLLVCAHQGELVVVGPGGWTSCCGAEGGRSRKRTRRRTRISTMTRMSTSTRMRTRTGVSWWTGVWIWGRGQVNGGYMGEGKAEKFAMIHNHHHNHSHLDNHVHYRQWIWDYEDTLERARQRSSLGCFDKQSCPPVTQCYHQPNHQPNHQRNQPWNHLCNHQRNHPCWQSSSQSSVQPSLQSSSSS